MRIVAHNINDMMIAEVISDDFIIRSSEDGADLLGNFYFQGFDRVILYEKNIASGFFDLNTGIAGEVLQKFSTYRVRLAIVGDFSKYSNNRLQEFIYESNRGRHINFLRSQTEAIKTLSSL